jgi:D-sedoheptulose 7-phosphate isomerase
MSIYFYQNYSRQIAQTLESMPWQQLYAMVQILHSARMASKQIFVLGNGGSASTASHLACDLNKNTAAASCPRFKVISLTDNMAFVSACANDISYEDIFSEQLARFIEPGDIVIAISTSGNSPNVLKAVQLANESGAFTIGWTGYQGGKLAQLVSMPIVVPNECIEQIEDMHIIMLHMITVALRQAAQTDRFLPVPMLLEMPVVHQ